MKSLMRLYDNCRSAIRISFFGFALIAFGFLIQNENVNIFYTFSNGFLLLLADASLKLGKLIILNLPLIFMVNFVCKKANSGFPIILAIIGYLTFNMMVSLFASQSMPSYVYSSSFKGLIDIGVLTNQPFETGLIGAFIVGFATRISYIHSRHRGTFSLLSFANKDTSAIIYNVFICAILGLLVAYLFPLFYKFLQTIITTISKNLNNPKNMILYGFVERIFAVLGLANIIRYPFWFTPAGGSFSNPLTGQSVYGDVNIWQVIQEASSTYIGCGRFVTAYYIINIFIIPAIFLGMWLSMSDKKEKSSHFVPLLGLILISILAGNPLPLELSLLFTAPLLLLIYLVVVALIFGVLSSMEIFLGFPFVLGDAVTAMPGSLPDLIVNIRSINFSDDVLGIIKIGLICFVVMLALTIIYYKFLAFDILHDGRSAALANQIISAVGGVDNIEVVNNSLLRVSINLSDVEKISYMKLKNIDARRIVESKDGIAFEFGTSSAIICKCINKIIKEG